MQVNVQAVLGLQVQVNVVTVTEPGTGMIAGALSFSSFFTVGIISNLFEDCIV